MNESLNTKFKIENKDTKTLQEQDEELIIKENT